MIQLQKKKITLNKNANFGKLCPCCPPATLLLKPQRPNKIDPHLSWGDSMRYQRKKSYTDTTVGWVCLAMPRPS